MEPAASTDIPRWRRPSVSAQRAADRSSPRGVPASIEEPLPPLPHPVSFVVQNNDVFAHLLGTDDPPPPEATPELFIDADDCWSVQTYVHLKRRGLDVRLVTTPEPGSICVTSYEALAIRDLPYQSFVVACRHDRGRPEICEQRIVQNPLNVQDETDHFIPHWPQPGLTPRETTRGPRVENVVYRGLPMYLAEPFRSDTFRAVLAEHGMRLVLSESDLFRRQGDWMDYRDADVVLAVRPCTTYDLAIKPPSKLINAWMAGCPALLGPEPAYQALRTTSMDYLEVATPRQAVDALIQLKRTPELYQAMISQGRRRAREFTPDRIARIWRDVLAGPVAESYERWREQPAIAQRLGRPIQFAWRCLKHKVERYRHQYGVRHGERPVTNNGDTTL